ncbi:MAG: hypothetical protein K1X64_07830 [Myxococcaceae bacterium]|nr:hypothetical protein [Myxococcaceae bacterium]
MRPLRLASALVIATLAGCAALRHAYLTDDLSGLTLPLLADGGMRLAVAGHVGGREATVLFDSTRELSSASQGCFADGAPLVSQVKMQAVTGAVLQQAGAKLSGLSVGQLRYRDIEVVIEPGTGCTVRLGLELLAPYALYYDAVAKRVTVQRSMSDEALAAQRQFPGVTVLSTEKTQGHEWPLLVTKVHQGPAESVATLVLATADGQSQLSSALLDSDGLKSLAQMAEALEQPLSSVPAELRDAVYVEHLALTPHVGVGPLWTARATHWRGTVQGTLAGDAWGTFVATFDFGQDVVVLHPQRVPPTTSSTDSPQQQWVKRYFEWLDVRRAAQHETEPAEP